MTVGLQACREEALYPGLHCLRRGIQHGTGPQGWGIGKVGSLTCSLPRPLQVATKQAQAARLPPLHSRWFWALGCTYTTGQLVATISVYPCRPRVDWCSQHFPRLTCCVQDPAKRAQQLTELLQEVRSKYPIITHLLSSSMGCSARSAH